MQTREPRARGGAGFSLVEILFTLAVLSILAAVAFGTFTAAKSKARAADVSQRVGEVAASIEAYRQSHGGSVTGVDVAAVGQAYTSTSNVTIKVCPNWSQGATSAGDYVVYGYVPSSAGAATPLQGTLGWTVDTGVGPSPVSGSAPTLCDAPLLM